MENMLRGSLTSTTDAKGVLGFKGERGYSNYEIYVKNGGTLTEEEWLEHFGVDLTGYAKTTEVSTMLDNEIGDLSELETENKDNTVDAINELKGNIDTLDERGVYSTTEKVVGEWIDGKPLYRKVLTTTITSSSAIEIPLNITNLKRIYNISGIVTNISNGGTGSVFTLPSYRGPSGTTGIQIYASNMVVNIAPESDRTGYDVYVIVEYTKTTD
jgi:hypothetical protein